jgi:hypothetical protein
MSSEITEGESTRALAPVPKPTTPRAIVMAEALKEDTEQRALLARYVDENMVEGTDYGSIPGTPQEVEISVGGRKKKVRKNNLLKPGAEKLFDLFRCRPEYEIMSRDVDREAGLYAYEIRCRAVNRETDTVLNEGVGSASSFESKYRYRKAERVCPSCGKANIRKSKPPREGWYCWEKTNGCGANFKADDPEILDQETGKMANPDLADVANTVLKMAKKRAQVDCAIALARVSDMFTQDVEDAAGDEGPPSPAKAVVAAAERQQREAKAAVQTVADDPDRRRAELLTRAARSLPKGKSLRVWLTGVVGHTFPNALTLKDEELPVVEAAVEQLAPQEWENTSP